MLKAVFLLQVTRAELGAIMVVHGQPDRTVPAGEYNTPLLISSSSPFLFSIPLLHSSSLLRLSRFSSIPINRHHLIFPHTHQIPDTHRIPDTRHICYQAPSSET